MKKSTKRASVLVAVCLVAVAAALAGRPRKAVPPTDPSHSIDAQPGTSSALASVLQRACGDCHSGKMSPHWSTRVPPFSTIMAVAARDGRKAVDFSEWTRYSVQQQRKFLAASCSDVTSGKMPYKAYLSIRRDARLSSSDIETICSASRQAGATSATPERRLP